jgi:hypothetical protein
MAKLGLLLKPSSVSDLRTYNDEDLKRIYDHDFEKYESRSWKTRI